MTDFAIHLENFFIRYLIGECNASKHTIRAYRDTFALLLVFMKDMKLLHADVLRLGDITKDIILDFLQWLETDRNNNASTRNQRYAAIRSFYKYLLYEDPTRIAQWQSIRSIRFQSSINKSMSYLTIEAVKLILSQIQNNSKNSRRNLALLALLYDSGARVQELIDLTPSCIRFEKPYTIKLLGKGKKERIVPLQNEQIELIKQYVEDFKLSRIEKQMEPLFFNHYGGKLSTAGVSYILKKYVDLARLQSPELIPLIVSPHVLRHSKAMHLLQAGVGLIYIRDFLGHSSIQTTEKYARVDSKFKREALEAAYVNVLPPSNIEPSWNKNIPLKDFLKSLG